MVNPPKISDPVTAQGIWSELMKRKSPDAAGQWFADYGCSLVLSKNSLANANQYPGCIAARDGRYAWGSD